MVDDVLEIIDATEAVLVRRWGCLTMDRIWS